MESNILFIVEGKLEKDFFNTISKRYGIKFDIYTLQTNVYSLYKHLKEMDFNANIKDVLAEMHPEQKELLQKKFAYTYLVFDSDLHHPKKNDMRMKKEIVIDNYKKLEEMANYFVNETDPTIGKLYINYPMMESFRDCNDFFDDEYKNVCVDIECIKEYKKMVASKMLHKEHVKDFTRENFDKLVLQNIFKLNQMIRNTWSKPKYFDYLNMSNCNKVLQKQIDFINNGKLQVINTSLLFVVDYYGEQLYKNLNL